MVEQLIEIPLPGRTFVAPASAASAGRTRATLPSFVAGLENRVVASAVGRLLSAANRAINGAEIDPDAPRLLALHGPSGVGKTHLARGLAEHWQSQRGPESAEYVTAADFRRALLDAMGDDTVLTARSRFRQLELLIIDDLHQLPNDPYLMEQLRYTLDECHDAGRRVLVTSATAATALPNLSVEVRSRLAGGLILQLAAPAAAARQQLVSQAARALGRPLSPEAARRLAAGVAGTANQLFAALFELLSGELDAAVSDVDLVSEYLPARAERRSSLREIIAVVARYYDMPQKLLKSGSRKQSAVTARATVVYLARELAGVSYEQIGRALGGRDHSTIMHNYQTIQRDLRRDWQTQETLDELHRILSSA